MLGRIFHTGNVGIKKYFFKYATDYDNCLRLNPKYLVSQGLGTSDMDLLESGESDSGILFIFILF